MLLAILEPLIASEVAGVVLVTTQAIVEQLDSDGRGLKTWTDHSDKETFTTFNDNPSSEMIDSVRIGIQAWRERQSIEEPDGFLVCPADHPGIVTDDFNICIRAFWAAPDRIVIATRERRRGHPIVWPAELIDFVDSPECDGGLHALSTSFPDRVLHVETRSPAVTRDIDTPDDYEALP